MKVTSCIMNYKNLIFGDWFIRTLQEVNIKLVIQISTNTINLWILHFPEGHF